MRFVRIMAVVVAASLASACWHTTVTTGKAPGSQVISDDWHTNWFFGLIPGAEVDASACKAGIAKVETQHSFLNLLVGYFVGIVWSPNSVSVTCAAGGSASLTPADKVVGHAGSTREEAVASFQAAAKLAAETGTAVYVKF
ncbi:MAG: hypothetical protein HYX65_00410 [Gemmatimonadetes bacterium]|nr:hypothetical protein [Gemmatimonadota bacterium]